MLSDEDTEDLSLDEIVSSSAEETKQQIIEKNLENMKFAKSKFRYAQECYYGNKGQSPLTRTFMEDLKPPVHTRLGKRFRFRTIPVGITTDSILPKTRRILRINRNNINTRGNVRNRLLRGFQAQLRIDRIRRQQAEALQFQALSPKLKLRRRRLNGISFPTTPTNYSIRIPSIASHLEILPHSVQDDLNMNIQNEIMRIQMMYMHPPETIVLLPPLPSNTAITLDERFSSLP